MKLHIYHILYVKGIGEIIGAIWFWFWWQDNGPYCCIHMCGQTTSMLQCWGNILVPILIIVGIMSMSVGMMYDLR